MPISQDRMIDTINALYDVIDILRATRQACSEAEEDAIAGRISQGEALKQIRSVLDTANVPEAIMELLGREREHFRRFEHTNLMNRERMRRLRGQPTVLAPPRRYTSSRTGYANGAPSADDQREAARAFIRAQATPPIVLPPEAALPPDFEERLAQAQASYDAEQAKPKAARFTRQDGTEVEVPADEPTKPGEPLIG